MPIIAVACVAQGISWAQAGGLAGAPFRTSDYFGLAGASWLAAGELDDRGKLLMERLAEVQTGWVGIDVDLGKVEPEEGRFDFAVLDDQVRKARQRGQKVLLRIAGSGAHNRAGGCETGCAPLDAAKFKASLTAVANRYRSEVRAWELYPGAETLWEGRAAEYAAILKAGWAAVKGQDRWARVGTGSTACLGRGDTRCADFAGGVVKALNGEPAFDFIGVATTVADGLAKKAAEEAQRVYAWPGQCSAPVWITSLKWDAEGEAGEKLGNTVRSLAGWSEVEKIFWDGFVTESAERPGLLAEDLSQRHGFYVLGYFVRERGFRLTPFRWPGEGCRTKPERTLHVAANVACASDANNGLSAACGGGNGPWKTVRKALGTVTPGDTVVIHEGRYREGTLQLLRSGTAGAPITLRGEGNAVIVGQGGASAGLLIHGNSYTQPPVSWVVIEGLTIEGQGVWNSAGAGIDLSNVQHITVRNNTIRGVAAGIVAPSNRWVVVENNEISDSYSSHGIYFSCRQNPPCSDLVIRGNLLLNNLRAGLQFNASALNNVATSVSGGLIEENTSDGNATDGPAHFSLYSAQETTVRENLIVSAMNPDGTGMGMTLYRQANAGGEPTRNLRILGNCIDISRSPEAVGFNMLNGTQSVELRGNTVVTGGVSSTPLLVEEEPLAELKAVWNNYMPNPGETAVRFRKRDGSETLFTLTQWKELTGLEENSATGQFGCPAPGSRKPAQ